MANSERTIINRILLGHAECFDEIVEGYKGLIFKTCLEFMKNEQDAMDMSQEVFIKIYNNLDKFKFKCKFTTWIFKICTNTCLSELRKKHRLNLPLEEWVDYGTSSSYEDPVETTEIKELIEEEINSMSHKKKSILKLRSLRKYTFEKIAEILKLPASSVRTEYTRARAQVSDRLKKYNKGE